MYELLTATISFVSLIQSEAHCHLQTCCVTCIKDEVTTLANQEANADLDPWSIFRSCLPHEHRALGCKQGMWVSPSTKSIDYDFMTGLVQS